MLRTIVLRCLPAVLLGAFILGVAGDVARAEKEVVNIPGTSWTTTGLVKESGGGEGSGTYPGEGNVSFGPLDEMSGTGPFIAYVAVTEEGGGSTTFEGTYALPKPGKPVLTIDLPTVQDDFVGETVLSATLKAKPKSKNGVQTMQLFVKIKAEDCGGNPTAVAGVDGKVKCQKFTVQYKGTGGLLPPK